MSILSEIVAHKHAEVTERARRIPLTELALLATEMPPARSFKPALQQSPAIIAEIKRRSPSRPSLREITNIADLAQDYEHGGAAALSVLTDARYFGMQLDELPLARNACSLPVLRKDFILDEYMVLESRVLGADALLLIAAVLGERELQRLLLLTGQLGMQALVEVHSEVELKRALAAGADIVGINARNLGTFEVDLEVVRRLALLAPAEVLLVAESGIRTRDDIASLQECGIGAFLIGESLLASSDPSAMLRSLREMEARV
jgi:indole-3-glycerol phosphate synthase